MFWKKIKQWEINIEKAPQPTIIRMCASVFFFSLALGAMLFGLARMWELHKLYTIENDIKKIETARMDGRIEKLKTILK